MRRALPIILLILTLHAGGCQTVDPRDDYTTAREEIGRSTGFDAAYDPLDEESAVELVEGRLVGGLTAEEAVHIALVNNPDLQQAFYSIGVSKADLVQSQLLSNPSVGVSVRFPEGGGLAALEGSFAQNLVDLWQLPLRKHLGERRVRQTILQVANQATTIARDAKAAHATALAMNQLVDIARENRAAADRVVEISTSLRDAGAGSGIDLNLSIAARQETAIALERAELAAYDAHLALARTLGIVSEPAALVLLEDEDKQPAELPAPDALLGVALQRRQDLAAIRMQLEALAAALELEQQSVFRVVQLGVEFERDARAPADNFNFAQRTIIESVSAGQFAVPEISPPDDQAIFVIGPSLSVQLPIFDQNQAQIARAEYQWRAGTKQVESILLDISRDVNLAHRRALVTKRIADYVENEVLPLQRTNFALAEEAYQAGKASVLTVLEAQRQQQRSLAAQVRAELQSRLALLELQRVTACPAQNWNEPAEPETTPRQP